MPEMRRDWRDPPSTYGPRSILLGLRRNRGEEMKMLDSKDRCCGRKPVAYKRGIDGITRDPHLYCTRCRASFNIKTGTQIARFPYVLKDGELVKDSLHA